MLFTVKIFAMSFSLFAAASLAGSLASAAALESAGCADSDGGAGPSSSSENEKDECYKLITTPKNLSGAVDYCTAQSMHLAFVTEKNAKTINNLVRDHFSTAEQQEPECNKRITMLANHDSARFQRYGTYAFTMGTGCNSSRSYYWYEVCGKDYDCSLVDWNAPSPFVCASSDNSEWPVTKYEQQDDDQFEYYVTENAIKSPVTEVFYPPNCTPFDFDDNVAQELENVRNFKKFDKHINFAILSSIVWPTSGAIKFCFAPDAQCTNDTTTAAAAAAYKDKTFGVCRVEKTTNNSSSTTGSRLVQLWPAGVVPYQFSGSGINAEKLSLIRDIMQKISDDSGACVKFQEQMTTTAASYSNKRDLVKIIISKGNVSNFCAAEAAGRTTGTQKVFFGSSCFNAKVPGQIMLQLLRTLGIPAEHTRFDRDQYIAVNVSNALQIEQIMRQLEKQPIPGKISLNTPYDFASVSHYGAEAFSRDGSLTIKVLKGGAVIGQRAALSAGDKAKLRLLYGDSKKQNCAV